MVDLRVVDISDLDFVLDMDRLAPHRVVSDRDYREVIAYTPNSI